MLDRLFLYDPETYLSLLARYNADISPNQWFAVAFGLVILLCAKRGGQANGRWAMAILVGFWAWTGFKFHLGYFAGINYLAPYYASAFFVQAAVIGIWGLGLGTFDVGLGLQPKKLMGVNLMVLAAVLQPVAAIAAGQAPDTIQAFGVTPMPTVLATLATFALLDRRPPIWVLFIPVVWCVWEILTAWTVGLTIDLILPIISLLTAALLFLLKDPPQTLPENGA